jgi:hypothetical protein
MSNEEMIKTLRIASEAQDDIALKMLLMYAAERIEWLHEAVKGNKNT